VQAFLEDIRYGATLAIRGRTVTVSSTFEFLNGLLLGLRHRVFGAVPDGPEQLVPFFDA